MAFPWIPAAFLGGGLLASGALNKKYNFSRPPEDIMMTDADVRSTYNEILGDLSSTQQGQIAGIKQVGAANRLPAGATQGRIAETAQQTAKGAARALPLLKENRRRSKSDYYQLLHNYELAQAGQQGAQQHFVQSGLGGLGQILTLWQGGYFNNPQGQAGGGMMNPNSILQNAPYQDSPLFDPNALQENYWS